MTSSAKCSNGKNNHNVKSSSDKNSHSDKNRDVVSHGGKTRIAIQQRRDQPGRQ
ncbi:MAG: hypothetical protein LBI88_01580 [Deltaproteobacteria bacterium]|nr:hypothetical protein [Deltaproteobacteria bacterium]